MARINIRAVAAALVLFIGALIPWSAAGAVTPVHTVACTEADLFGGVTLVNGAGVGTLKLASNCLYQLTAPLPDITGDLVVKGGTNTSIARAPSLADARIFNVLTGGSLDLSKLTLLNGDVSGLGGAVQSAGSLVISKVTFVNNRAANGGAVSVGIGSTAIVTGSTFIGNQATSVGGGAIIVFGNATLTVKSSVFTGNLASINGAAINVQGAATALVDLSTFSGNKSGSLGGAISSLGTLEVKKSTLTGNIGSSGGAIATGNSNVTLSANVIKFNVPDNCSPANSIDGCVD